MYNKSLIILFVWLQETSLIEQFYDADDIQQSKNTDNTTECMNKQGNNLGTIANIQEAEYEQKVETIVEETQIIKKIVAGENYYYQCIIRFSIRLGSLFIPFFFHFFMRKYISCVY